MKYAILGDIHANLEALQAVLSHAEKQGVSHYVCMGDIVGYNPDPVACLELIQEKNMPVVRGNHDHYCSQDVDLSDFSTLAQETTLWTREQLTAEHKTYLANLPYIKQVETFTLVHATLDSPEGWGYVLEKSDAEASMNYQHTSVCFCGHTHIPVAFDKSDSLRAGLYSTIKIKLGHKYLINVGSVGQPRDGDPRAAYALFDLYENTITLHRVEYDIEKTGKKVLQEGLPPRIAQRLTVGR